MGLLKREPAAIAGFVQASLALLMAFGVKLTIEQTGAVLALTAALLGLLVRARVFPIGSK